MAKVLSIMNYKGGTGKTTTVINVGACLAQKGYKTLLVDLDPQSNLSEGLNQFDVPNTLYYAFKTNSEPQQIEVSKNLYLIASNLESVGFDFDLARQDYKEKVLDNMLSDVIEKYDYVLLDLPPTLNTMVVNSLVISNKIIIPMEAEFFAYRGLDRIMDIVKKVKKNSNSNLDLLGVMITKYLPNRNLSTEILDAVKTHFEGKLFETKIRSNIKLSEAQANGKSIFEYDNLSNGAVDYGMLTEEIISKF